MMNTPEDSSKKGKGDTTKKARNGLQSPGYNMDALGFNGPANAQGRGRVSGVLTTPERPLLVT